MKIICTLIGVAYFSILAQNADAFTFSLNIFALNREPVSEDVITLLFLLAAGIVGFIGFGRRKLKK